MRNFKIQSFGDRKSCPLRPQTIRIQSQLETITHSGRKHWDLFRHLLSPELLADATKLVLQNKGSAGVDNVTCEEVREMGWSFIARLQEKLRSRTYHPKAVRRVYIPKKDGRKRPLGIPSLEDRVIQRALVLLMEPIYEQIFLPCSYGFRPGKRATDCVADAAKSIYRNRFVIDADIKGFFDNVSHKKLMGMLKEQIVDKRILNLIQEILKAGYMDDGWKATEQGTPQGGPLSPLLANIYLHYLLDSKFKEVQRDKTQFELFRYASISVSLIW